jgi:phenylacetate-CoA ligase
MDRADRRASQVADYWATYRCAIASNPFYHAKFLAAGCLDRPIRTWADYRSLPFTTKSELVEDQTAHPPYGTNRGVPLASFCRIHQTSGTSTGRPLRWLDTATSWSWVVERWYDGLAGLVRVRPDDRVFFPFSFGPFLGFWAGFEAITRNGIMALPGGGMPSSARLKYLLEHRATVVCCTPTYALHLAETAAAEQINLANSPVRALVVAGEPGGAVPAIRERIEAAWGARVFDHYGLSEVGPVAFECPDAPRQLRVLEQQFIVEVLEPGQDREVSEGETGEVVITNLGRSDCPVIRYRTGDLVVPALRNGELFFNGGVIGRVDDMIHVRGNNLYPTAIEAVVMRFPEVAEYRIVIDQTGPLTDLRIEIEPTNRANGELVCKTLSQVIRDELLFRAAVVAVPPGSLPRFEMKARRVVKIGSPNSTPKSSH